MSSRKRKPDHVSHAYPNSSFTSDHEVVQNRIQRRVKKRPRTVKPGMSMATPSLVSGRPWALDWVHRLVGRRSQCEGGNYLTYYLRLNMVIGQICIYTGGATE